MASAVTASDVTGSDIPGSDGPGAEVTGPAGRAGPGPASGVMARAGPAPAAAPAIMAPDVMGSVGGRSGRGRPPVHPPAAPYPGGTGRRPGTGRHRAGRHRTGPALPEPVAAGRDRRVGHDADLEGQVLADLGAAGLDLGRIGLGGAGVDQLEVDDVGQGVDVTRVHAQLDGAGREPRAVGGDDEHLVQVPQGQPEDLPPVPPGPGGQRLDGRVITAEAQRAQGHGGQAGQHGRQHQHGQAGQHGTGDADQEQRGGRHRRRDHPPLPAPPRDGPAVPPAAAPGPVSHEFLRPRAPVGSPGFEHADARGGRSTPAADFPDCWDFPGPGRCPRAQPVTAEAAVPA